MAEEGKTQGKVFSALAPRLARVGGYVALAMALFAVARGAFLVRHFESLGKASASEILRAFALGSFFDLSLMASLLLLYGVLYFAPVPGVAGPRARLLQRGAFFALVAPWWILEWSDVEFYAHSGRRLTLDALLVLGDGNNQILNFAVEYWWAILAMAATLGLLYWGLRKIDALTHPREPLDWRWNLALLPLALLLFVLGTRGSIGSRPLSPGHAFRFSTPELGNLALSTSYVFSRSIQAVAEGRTIEPVRYVDPASAAYSAAVKPWPLASELEPSRRDPLAGSFQGQNVVLIILESFSAEFVGAYNPGTEHAPFLTELARRSALMPWHHANARRSMVAIPSILASVPDWVGSQLIVSNYQSNRMYGLGNVLSENGYSTAFFHGAYNTLGLDYFTRTVGFSRFFGPKEYEGASEDFDKGGWGIFDEPFLQFALREMGKLPRPFGAAVFTISSHQPYHLPPKLAEDPRFRAPGKLHRVIRYTDYALQRFFEEAEKQPWYKDTLFVVTADHTDGLETPEFKTDFGRFHVPLLFFHPSRKLELRRGADYSQHLDLIPTISDFLGIRPSVRIPFGRSLLSEGPGRLLLFIGGAYVLVEGDRAVSWPGRGEPRVAAASASLSRVPAGAYSLEGSRGRAAASSPAGASAAGEDNLKLELKALVQYLKNGFVSNSFFGSAGAAVK